LYNLPDFSKCPYRKTNAIAESPKMPLEHIAVTTRRAMVGN
jgi:hypothetical protein